MTKDLVGKHGETNKWARRLSPTEIEWVDNIFPATKFEHNDAVTLVTKLKSAGIDSYTEPVFNAINRLTEEYLVK